MNGTHQILATERLTLRPCAMSDTGFLHQLWTDPLVRRFLWDDCSVSIEEVASVVAASLDSFAQAQIGCWMVTESASQQSVGFAGLREFGEDAEIELLYALLPEYHGRGLATEAAMAVLTYGFTAGGLSRIWAGTDPPNSASIRVIERLGMIFEGERDCNGLPAVYYSLVRDRFFADRTDVRGAQPGK